MRAWWLCLLVAQSGCTLATAVDVCQRTGPPEHDVNQRTEGDQYADPHGLVRLPGAGAMLVFTSVPGPMMAEVRRARLDADGTSLPTCEVTTGEPTVRAPTVSTRATAGAAVAFPAVAGAPGLLVHQEFTTVGSTRIFARVMQESGCVDLADTMPPTLVAETSPGTLAGFVNVVWLGDRRFVVSWNEINITTRSVRLLARVLDVMGTVQFLPTRESPDGSAAVLPPDGDLPLHHALMPLGSGRFAALWYETGLSRFRVRYAVFDDRLAVVGAPQLLDEVAGSVSFDAPLSMALSFDGEIVFAAWSMLAESDAGRLYGTFLDASGAPLTSARAPEGGRFRLGSLVSGTEADVTATTIPGGGFLVAWTERDALGRTDALGSGIRAVGLTPNGETLFSNRACDRADFPMALDFDGDQSRPLLATLDDGTILFVYTNLAGGSDDRSGTGIRGTGLRRSDLFTP